MAGSGSDRAVHENGRVLGAVTEVIGVAADSRAVDLTRTNVLFTYLP